MSPPNGFHSQPLHPAGLLLNGRTEPTRVGKSFLLGFRSILLPPPIADTRKRDVVFSALSAAALLGMVLVSATIGNAILSEDKKNADGTPSSGFGSMFAGDGVTRFTRVQYGIWTSVLVVVFVYHVFTYKQLLDLDATTLSLMGISKLAYLGSKQFGIKV